MKLEFRSPHVRPNHREPSLRLRTIFGLSLGALVLSGCTGGGSGGGNDASNPELTNGTIATNTATGQKFIAEVESAATTQGLVLEETYWGRLVDVYQETAPGVVTAVPVITDFVIGDDILGETDQFELRRDPLTERERLTIKFPPGVPTQEEIDEHFRTVLLSAEANLQVLLHKSLDPTELPPFTSVPRNSALVLRFNELLDDGGSPTAGNQQYPGTVKSSTLKLLTGYAPTQPHEARIFPDPTHGNLVGGVFHSSRIIVDFSISEDDSEATNLPVNALGLPEALNTTQANCVVRIPTRTSPAFQQFEVLRSLRGRTVQFNGNGPTDPASQTLDVVRAFRSGGKAVITGDANNGFLVDEEPPYLIGVQAITVTGANNPSADLREFDLFFRFASVACAYAPRKDDVVNISGGPRVQVLTNYAGGVSGNGTVGPVRVRMLCTSCPSLPTAGAVGECFTTLLANPNLPELGACFVKFSPAVATPPNAGVATNATMTVRFSEPMDPQSVQAFDTYTISYGNNAPSTDPVYANVIGRIIPSQDLRQFTFQPVVPLRKQLPGGSADTFAIDVFAGAGGVTDLAGNSLAVGLQATPFKISTTAASVDSGGIALKFNSGNEDANPGPEVRGQILYDIVRQLVKPRAVARFSAVCDNSVPVVGAMIQFTAPIQTPLSNYGSKMMGVWRYHDVGFSLRDDANQNIDVEGLWWTPFSGTVQIDNFSEFQISLAHSKYLPDEELSSGLLPNWGGSGLVTTFANNQLDAVGDPLTIVHPKAKGYTISQADVTTSATNNSIAPWPINRGVPQSQFTYWTWRDTGKIQVAGPGGNGADTQRLQQVTKTGNLMFYPVNKVPTVALPLLMEFRTYPDAKASGQNGFKVSLAINSSAYPLFRVYSTGGVNVNNPAQIKYVYPDAEPTATGAYPQNGLPAPGKDNVVYWGQADFLVRVSRMHTIWFDTTFTSGVPQFADPVIEPSSSLLPAGTQVVVAYRGASTFVPAPVSGTPHASTDAGNTDSYGDGYTSAQLTSLGNPPGLAFYTPTFFNVPANTTDKSWKSVITQINGARFFQARVTFIANPDTTLVPELSALGFAFRR